MASPIRSLCTAGAALTMLVLASPAAWASQATALKCKDGTTSASTGRGACSGHGGVDKTASKAASKTVKTQEKVAKTVAKTTPGAQVTQMCADGTTSNSTGRGACSGHGGVRGAAATSKTTGVPIAAAATATPPKPGKVYNKPITTPAPKTTSVAGSGAREDKNPAGAIAQCKDGMYSHSKNRTGTCSKHGGVAKWL
jgi:Protein of unknown function (DUF3761)